MRFRVGSGVGRTLTTALLVVAAFAMSSMAVSYFSFKQLGGALSVITEERLPRMLLAERLAAASQDVVGAAPTMIAAPTLERKDAIYSDIKTRMDEIVRMIDDIASDSGDRTNAGSLSEINQAVRAKLADLDAAITRRFAAAGGKRDTLATLRGAINTYRALLRPKIEVAGLTMTVIGNEVAKLRADQADDDREALRAELIKLSAAATDRGLLNEMDKLADGLSAILLSAAAEDNVEALAGASTRGKSLVDQLSRHFRKMPDMFDKDAAAAVLERFAALAVDPERSLPAIRARELRLIDEANGLYADLNTLSQRMRGRLNDLLSDITTRSEAEARRADRSEQEGFLLILLVGSASVLVALGSTVFVRVRILRRFDRLRHCMGRLAANDLGVEVPVDGRDEITEMAKALEVFRDTARQVEAADARAEAERERAAGERRAAMLALADQFDARIKGLVSEVASGADTMHRTATDLAGVAGSTSREANEAETISSDAATNVDSVAAAAEEMACSIAEITRQVQQSVVIARRAVSEAERADATAGELTVAAGKIGEVVALIESIAGRTTLLALNASIEAARAGSQGKGFAVVAGEVKSLAAQTTRATGDIVDQVEAMRTATREMVAAINGIGDTIKAVDGISSRIAAAVETQDETTREIARGIHHAAGGTERVMANITRVTGEAGRVAGAAAEMLNAASLIRRQAGALTRDVDAFLGQIRHGGAEGC